MRWSAAVSAGRTRSAPGGGSLGGRQPNVGHVPGSCPVRAHCLGDIPNCPDRHYGSSMESRRIPVRGAELAVRLGAGGFPFVWAHGLLRSMAQEDDAGLFDLSILAPRWQVVRYDARGHGESSPADDDAAQRWPSLAEDLLAILDELGMSRVAAGGASMGAATVLHAATLSPDRFDALVLALPPTAWSGRRLQAAFYRGMAVGAATGVLPVAACIARRIIDRPVVPGTKAHLREVALDHLGTDAAVGPLLAGAAKSDLPPDAYISRLTMPVLILAWSGDPTHPLSTAGRLRDLLPNNTLIVADREVDLLTWPTRIRTFLDEHVPEKRRKPRAARPTG